MSGAVMYTGTFSKVVGMVADLMSSSRKKPLAVGVKFSFPTPDRAVKFVRWTWAAVRTRLEGGPDWSSEPVRSGFVKNERGFDARWGIFEEGDAGDGVVELRPTLTCVGGSAVPRHTHVVCDGKPRAPEDGVVYFRVVGGWGK